MKPKKKYFIDPLKKAKRRLEAVEKELESIRDGTKRNRRWDTLAEKKRNLRALIDELSATVNNS